MSRKRENKSRSLPQQPQPDLNQVQQAYLQAQQLQQAGYLTEAEKLYRQILEVIPEQPDSLHYLGLIYMQKGDFDQAGKFMQQSIKLSSNPVFLCNYGLLLSNRQHDEAIKQYEKALQLKPDYAEAWFNLGVSFSNTGRLDEAENAYKKALSYRENYIKALNNLVCVQEMQSKSDEARKTFEQILKIVPDSAEAHNNLGAALAKTGGSRNIRKAEQHFREALTLNPKYLEAYVNLGRLYEDSNRIDGAIKCYTKALELEPEYQDASIHLASVLVHDSKYPEAKALYSDVIAKNPHNSMAVAGMGNLKKMIGKFSEAEALYNKALEININETSAYFGLSGCRKYTLEDKEFIKKLKKYSSLSASINFALGKMYNDIGDYDESFMYYRRGNELRNNKIDYDAQENTELIGRIIDFFSNELINNLRTGGNPTELPVFILGAPRSGTTLVEQIISSHPDVYGAGELKYIYQQIKKIKNTKNGTEKYPECMKDITPADIARFAREYIEYITALCEDRNIRKITDKMPGNFVYIGFIASLFPNAKIIHCRRNPLDTCLSIYFQSFNSGHRYGFNLENLGYWYKDYLKLMEHWNSVLGNCIYNVNYVDVINNTEDTTRKLIEHCGLEWDDRCLQFHTVNRAVKTASQWQVRQPVYNTSLDIWKRYDKHIGPLKEILAGYN